MSIYNECLRFVLMKNTLVHYCHKYYYYVRAFHLLSRPLGKVLYNNIMWLYQGWSSLDLKLFTDGDDI